MFKKNKVVRLSGKAIEKLNFDIHERDDYSCVLCGKYVSIGEKFHHAVHGNGRKSDVIENGVTICYRCHQEVHFGRYSREANDTCLSYLQALYGDKNWDRYKDMREKFEMVIEGENEGI